MENQLEIIANEIKSCKLCDLYLNRKNAVPGEGKSDASLVIVGEAPGRNEDLYGRPFVGMAGKFLDKYLKSAGIERNSIFITNAVKCRPPNNRKPSSEELITCRFYLIRQLNSIHPKIVLALGVSAAYSLNIEFKHLEEIRGKLINKEFGGLNLNIYVTFHPSFPMRFPSKREAFLNDLKKVKESLEI